jgi:hypothetical protein
MATGTAKATIRAKTATDLTARVLADCRLLAD